MPTIAAETGKATRRELVERLVVRGPVAAPPNEDIKVAAQVAGRVVSMTVAEGDRVRAGHVLAQLEVRPLEEQQRSAAAAVEQARAALEAAESNLGRTQKLFERGIAAGKEVEDARAQRAASAAALAQARAGLEAAERQVSRSRVTSPIDGQVVKRFVGVGEQVDGSAAQPLLEVANVERVEIAAQVPAEHLGEVRERMAAEVVCEALPGRTFEGRVVGIAPALDPATNTALVRVAVANPEGLLKVGMFAEVRLALQSKKDALVVPATAITRGDDGPAVYVVSGDLATRTPVKTGISTSDAVEILSGVTAGQTVLVSSVHGLARRPAWPASRERRPLRRAQLAGHPARGGGPDAGRAGLDDHVAERHLPRGGVPADPDGRALGRPLAAHHAGGGDAAARGGGAHGARRAARALEDDPRRLRGLGPLQPRRRHALRAAAAAGQDGRGPRRPAGRHGAGGRADDAVAVPDLQRQRHGRRAGGRPA